MNEQDFEKRFHKLKNAYDKLEERTNPADVMHQLKPKVEPIEIKQKRRAWHIPLLSAAAIVLLFGLGMSMIPKENMTSSEELYEEEPLISALDMDLNKLSSLLKDQFEQMEEEQFEKSGLTREQFFSMPSVNRAKQIYTRYMTGKIDNYYFGVSEEIVVPLMIEELKRDLLTPREVLVTYMDEFDQIPVDLYMSKNILQTYSERYQEYAMAKAGEGLVYTRINDADRDLLDELLDPTLAPILNFYETGPIMYAGDMIQELDVLPELFIPMEGVYAREEIMMNDEKHDLATLLFLSAKGTMSKNLDEQQAAVFENGVVKEEFRKVWKRYAEQPEYTLSALIFRPMVEQMEQTNWTQSEAWVQFDYEDAMAHLDNLDNGHYGIPAQASTPVVIDDAFVQKIHGYFKSLALEDSSSKYSELSPEEIVGLYHYYGQLGEIELRYELYIQDERYMQISKEDYLTGTSIQYLPLKEYVKSYTFKEQSVDSNGYLTGVVEIELTDVAIMAHDTPTILIQVIQTEEGWKIPFMPTQ